MKFTAQNTRNDPPLTADEIELAPGSIGQAPIRILKSDAVPALARATDDLAKFEAESAAERARLLAEKEAAAGIQAQLDELLALRGGIPPMIAKAKADLQNCIDRMVWLEAYALANFDKPLRDHIEEFQRQEFLAKRLPDYMAQWRGRLAELEAEIAAFKTANGIA